MLSQGDGEKRDCTESMRLKGCELCQTFYVSLVCASKLNRVAIPLDLYQCNVEGTLVWQGEFSFWPFWEK